MFDVIEPFDGGLLDVGDGQRIYWECSGNPDGRPIVYLHGGPGSGCSPRQRRWFDPNAYRIILTDQRGCGRSLPTVQTRDDLRVNTTQHLIADLERLREHLGVERWLLMGGSWGTTLALAYAQMHPQRVLAAVLACVTTTSRREVRWITEGMKRFFPREWKHFAALTARDPERGRSIVDRYAELAFSDDDAVCQEAAKRWCAWEDVHVSLAPGHAPNPRFEDPDFRLLFTRLVTQYWRHAGFVADGELIRNASRLRGIPAILIHGSHDVSSPVETAWNLHRAWAGSELEIVEDAGHGGGRMLDCIIDAVRRISSVVEARSV